MRNLDTLTFHPTAERLVEILCKMTHNYNPTFFRIMLSYYLGMVAAMMRVKIKTLDRGIIPVNMYAINLGPSGLSKTYSTNIIVEQILGQFDAEFLDKTYPIILDESLADLAIKRAYAEGEDPDVVRRALDSEYHSTGEFYTSFDSATKEAIKQAYHKLILAKIGSINLDMDEVGSNFLGNVDVLSTFLDLYDVGKTKQKLTKNTRDNNRHRQVTGKVPANLNLYGTYTKLLNGGRVEDEFYDALDIGLGRRCLFGFSTETTKKLDMTAQEYLDATTDQSLGTDILNLSAHFGTLADVTHYNKILTVNKAVTLQLIEYRLHCERQTAKMGEYEKEARKAEMSHRYFKTLKLAGAYAFMDGHSEITEDNLYHAICLVEESGKSFNRIMDREKPYEKLAKFIAEKRTDLTQVELTEQFPFYKGSVSQKNDLMQLAIAWGYKNQIIIKRTINSGIEFVKGESLEGTDLNKIKVAYSHDISDGYKNAYVPFDKLHGLVLQPNKHWINHYSVNGHRDDAHMAPGFNMVVLDVDDGVRVRDAVSLMKDYKFLIYTTKRHTAQAHRFRMILPLNYNLSMTQEEYREFMKNIFTWLPFKVDTSTGQRSRKWLSHNGQHFYSKGDELLNALLFIPKTFKNDEEQQIFQSLQSLENLERWFVREANKSGNRNNSLIRYALILIDGGHPAKEIKDRVLFLNERLDDKLSRKEINDTIMVTVHKEINKRKVNNAAKAA